jgi:hypothetical protein
VVQVLPAARRIDAGGLEVTEGIRADPNVLPGRRNGQLANALELLGRIDTTSMLVEVAETAAPTDPSNSGA